MKLSIVTVNHNSSKYVEDLISSAVESYALCNGFDALEVIVVDNCSREDDYQKIEKLRDRFDDYDGIQIRILRLSKNYGYSGAVNVGVKLAVGDIVAVSNPDVIIKRDFLAKLEKLYGSLSSKLLRKSIIAPKILLGNSNRINSTGLALHIAGYGILLNLNKHEHDPSCEKPRFVLAPHGALFIAYKDILLDLGPFDPYYFCFLEDLDLGLRAYAKGYYVIYIPTLIARHYWGSSWGRGLSKTKYYYSERNRLLTLLKNMPLHHIALSFAHIILSEFISLGYALLNGYLSTKFRIYADLTRILPQVIHVRRSILLNSRYSDNCFLNFMIIKFDHTCFDQRFVDFANKLFNLTSHMLGINTKLKHLCRDVTPDLLRHTHIQ